MLELGGDVRQLRRRPARLGEQCRQLPGAQRFERDPDHRRGRQLDRGPVELAGPVRADEHHVPDRRRDQLGHEQERVLVGPLQVVDGHDQRAVPRSGGHQADGGPMEPVAPVGRLEVGDRGGGVQDLVQPAHQRLEHPGHRRPAPSQVGAPLVALTASGRLHGAHQRAERLAERRVGRPRALLEASVGEYATAAHDVRTERLEQRRLADAGNAAEQHARPAAPPSRLEDLSESGQLGPSPDQPALDVERWCGHRRAELRWAQRSPGREALPMSCPLRPVLLPSAS